MMANPKSTKMVGAEQPSDLSEVRVTNSELVSDSVVPLDSNGPTGDAEKNDDLSKSLPPSVQINSSNLKPGLPEEVVDLVTELRETVKRIDPKKHTPNSLRRALSSVSDILSDIETFSPLKR